MIIDYERNSKLYTNIHALFDEGFQFIDSLKKKPVGRYEHGEMFAMVQDGTTASAQDRKIEAHRKYIDIQYMIKGTEVMEWENIKNLQIDVPYDSKKDIEFYKGNGVAVQINPGMFYIVFPEDGHKPCVHRKEATNYRKIVLKINIEKLAMIK